jgi:glucose-1-phosphate cytidylyltransferase
MNEHIPVVILAGGSGTMLGSPVRRPKTMVELNGLPLLDHILSYFIRFGFKKFIIAGGLGWDRIEAYVQKAMNERQWPGEGLSIHTVNTGLLENSGARLNQLKPMLQQSNRFIMTYSDVVSDVPLDTLIQFHDKHGSLATLTAVHAPSRFRILGLHPIRNEVLGFAEKPIWQKDYISGGFYVLSNKVFDLPVLSDPMCSFEFNILQELVSQKQVIAFRHEGYWQSLDTERDMLKLEDYLNNLGAKPAKQ